MVKVKQLVKISMKGKVKIQLSKLVVSAMRIMIEDYINNTVCGSDLVMWSEDQMCKALIEEIYNKYHNVLHTNNDSVLSLTRAQAIALWEMLYADDVYDNHPQIGILYMQLHQKLS